MHTPRAARLAAVCVLGAVSLAAATDLENLAAIPAVSGSEEAAAAYVRERLGPSAEVDNTGSVTIVFGKGGKTLLLAAGLDEPGYAVSQITSDGYLRLHRLAEPAPSYQFDSFFVGRPVSVAARGGAPLLGVVAAPAVHLNSGRGYAGSRQVDDLWVDIGAASRSEAAAAGVAILDTVRLDRSTARHSDGETVFGPWLSGRAGAAVLLALADAWKSAPPPGRIALTFVTQQRFHNAGLQRALARLEPARAVVIRPGGHAELALGPVSGWSPAPVAEWIGTAQEKRLPVARAAPETLSRGPFESSSLAPAEGGALLTLGPRNPNSPVEAVSWKDLAAAAGLLASLAGATADLDWETALRKERPAPPTPENPRLQSPVEELLAELTMIPGVSGGEDAVREAIAKRVPGWARPRTSTDGRGNLIVRLGQDEAPETVFIAHMDEIGFRVTRSSGDGALQAETRGGVSEDLFAWEAMAAMAPHGPIYGWMARAGTLHVGQLEGETAGILATVPRAYRRLLGSRVNARAIDDRAGCAAMLHALRSLDPRRRKALESKPAIWLIFSVEEETGLLGAKHLAENISPRRVYAIDSLVTSDSPLESKRVASLPLGGGAAIRAIDQSGIAPRAEVERVAAIARKAGIPVQIGVTAGGNDGSKFVRSGAVNIPLSFPLRYSHTAAETADLRDIEALSSLILELLR